MRTDQARSGQDKSALIGKLRTPKPVATPIIPTKPVDPRRPARDVETTDAGKARATLPMFRSASAKDILGPNQANSSLIDALRRSAIDQKDRVVFTWPERIFNPLSAALLVTFNLRQDHPDQVWTLAMSTGSKRLKYESRRVFVQEASIAANALKRFGSVSDLRRGPNFYFDYLIHKTNSAKMLPNRTGQPIGSPNLFELVPVFEPSETNFRCPYPTQADNFLADIETKRPLLKNAPDGSDCASHIDKAPLAVLMLPNDFDAVAPCVRHTPRLRDGADLVLVDLTREMAWDAKSVMSNLRKLKSAFSVPHGRPAFVMVCNDAFLAQRCREILADTPRTATTDKRRPAAPAVPDLTSVELVVGIKPQASDFTDLAEPKLGRDVPVVSVSMKNASLVEFRQRWSGRARELDLMGWTDAAFAIRKGAAFLSKIASLPIGYASLIQNIEGAEEERGLNPWISAQYKIAGLVADLDRAAKTAEGYGAEVRELRAEVISKVHAFRNATEISECVRDHLEQATKKANRTLFITSGELVSEALRDHVLAGRFEGLDLDRLRRKVLFASASDVDEMLASSARAGAQVDTVIVIQPTIKGIQRLAVAPRLAKKLVLIGDAVTLSQIQRHLREVATLLPDLSGRTDAICKAIDLSTGAGWDDLAADEVARPLSGATVLDFSQDGQTAVDAGPRMLITTVSGYRLRYRAKGDCIIQQDDHVSPFKKVQAGRIMDGDGILIMTGRLQERLDHLLGPVDAGDDTFLRLYRQHVQAQAAAMPQATLRAKAAALLERMREVAARSGASDESMFGRHAVSNVARWLSVHVDDGSRQPKAPKYRNAFKCFSEALGIDELIARQFWENSIKKTRVENVLAGARETARAFAFLLNPHQFYHAKPDARDGLKSLFSEMTRSFDEVVKCQIEK